MNDGENEVVTVIVPVFNTQQYLVRCVDSIITQTYQNLQIILVDDGSTDNSAAICDDYAARDPRIEVIHRENGGLSAARNTGLCNTRGDWVAFLDSDDYYSRRFVEFNLATCKFYDADIVICMMVYDREGDRGEDIFTEASRYECITGREAAIRHFGKESNLFNCACRTLCRVTLWKGLRFPEGKINEDVFVSHQLLYSSKRIVISDALLYAYYQRIGSIMRRPFTLARLDALDAWHEGIRYFEKVGEHDLFDIARRVYCNRLFDAYGLCKKLLPEERDTHVQLRRQANNAYREVRSVRSYIDLSAARTFAYKGKQFIGRYFPALYFALFLKDKEVI